MEDEIGEIPPYVTTVVGLAMFLSSLLFVVMNYVLIKVILANGALCKLNAYRLMIVLAVTDVANGILHGVTGIITVARYDYEQIPYLAQAFDAFVVPTFVFYALVTIVLAVNRFALTYSPTLEKQLFSDRGMKAWIIICLAISSIFYLGFVTNFARMTYSWRLLSWNYDYSTPHTRLSKACSSFIEIVGIAIASALYILIFIMIFRKAKNRSAKYYQRVEWRSLIHSFVLTVFLSGSDALWLYYFDLFPDSLAWYSVLNYIWILNSALNPIMYYCINTTLRRKITLHVINVIRPFHGHNGPPIVSNNSTSKRLFQST